MKDTVARGQKGTGNKGLSGWGTLVLVAVAYVLGVFVGLSCGRGGLINSLKNDGIVVERTAPVPSHWVIVESD